MKNKKKGSDLRKKKLQEKRLSRSRGIIEESLLSLAGFKGCGVLRNSGVGDATVGGGQGVGVGSA